MRDERKVKRSGWKERKGREDKEGDQGAEEWSRRKEKEGKDREVRGKSGSEGRD